MEEHLTQQQGSSWGEELKGGGAGSVRQGTADSWLRKRGQCSERDVLKQLEKLLFIYIVNSTFCSLGADQHSFSNTSWSEGVNRRVETGNMIYI